VRDPLNLIRVMPAKGRKFPLIARHVRVHATPAARSSPSVIPGCMRNRHHMMSSTSAQIWLLAFSAVFALAGIAYARKERGNLEDYIVARNSQGAFATILTLLASSLGAWILFSPAQAATWGGLGA